MSLNIVHRERVIVFYMFITVNEILQYGFDVREVSFTKLNRQL